MDTLDNLIFTNGAEDEPVKKTAKKAAKKAAKKVAKKAAKKESKYSREYLQSLSAFKLRGICSELGLEPRADIFKSTMIEQILNK